MTTVLAALLTGDRAILAHVGDCRAYLLKDGRIHQLTRDHTWVGELRYGSRYEKYVEWYRKWLKRDPPPQRFYDYNKY